MIVKGRCRGNGAQLAAYLLNSQDNDRAEFLAVKGTANMDARRALLEMSLSSELTGRTKNGLYHTQLSPRESEAADMTHEQKMRSVEIMAERLGMEGHKWALFEHEKEGRTHLHLVFERYDHETGKMWDDNKNYAKHTAAARQMEREFGWQLTHENKTHLDQNIKGHITDMWIESDNGAAFVQSMHRAGFEVTQGIDKRPFQIVDQYGTVHDLTRQLQGFKQADVSQYLNGIRSDLRPTAEASHDRRSEHERDQPEPEQSDVLREMSDSQDVAEAMKAHYKEQVKEQQEPPTQVAPAPESNRPPSLPHQPDEKTQSDKSPEISESQDTAAAMLRAYRQRQAEQQERQRKAKEMQQQAAAQTKKQQESKSITDEAAEMLEHYRQRQNEREQGRDGPDYD